MSSPQISVIIPLYNKEKEIERAINSVLSQTYTDFELIIVNDGSTDKSFEIAKSFENNNQVRIFSQENIGLPATRNRGIREARADFVSFLDADDEWYPDFLETLMSLRQKYPDAGLYATSYCYCNDNGIVYPKSSIPDGFEGILHPYFKYAPEFPFVSICVGIPKSTFESVGYFNPNIRMHEDNEMWTRIALVRPIAFSKKSCACYNQGTTNQMTRNYYPLVNEPIIDYITSFPREALDNHSECQYIYRYMDYVRLETGIWNVLGGERKIARSFFASINEKELLSKKWLWLFLSYFPLWVIDILSSLRKILRTILNI